MANNIITMKGIAWEMVAELRNNLAFSNLVNRSYDNYFAKSGKKIGNSLQVVLPVVYRTESGGPITTFQDHVEEYINLSVQQEHVPLQFTMQDLLLSMDNFKTRVIRPAAHALAQKIDSVGLQMAAVQTGNIVGDGTETMSDSLILEAGAVLSDNSAPLVDRRLVLSSIANAQAIKSMGALFNSQAVLTKMFEDGLVTRNVYGFDGALDQNVVAHRFGTGVQDPVKVAGANQTGNSLKISGLTGNLNPGDKFTIAGVYKKLLTSGETTEQLMQFSVVSVNTAKDTITIEPPLKTVASNGNNANVSASPATGADLTFVGTAGAIADYNLAFQKDAYILVVVDDNEDRPGAETALATDASLGLSVRVTKQYSATTDNVVVRADVWFGWGKTRNELSTVIATSRARIA